VPTRVFSHNNYFGPSYQHDFSVGSLILGAGTYWLGLHNGPLTTDSRKDYYWETTSANATIRGNEDKSPFDDGSWFNNIQEHAFQLYGTQVPVPGAIFLFGPGLAALALLRKRLTG